MLFEDTYKTIDKIYEGQYKDRGSRFIAIAYPVTTEVEVKTLLGSIKKKYYDACHHCYAYRIGYDKLIYRINDDGEPSGTAGKPIYNQILSNDLTNILIVVIRYFGGTLLGVSGLINSYKNATKDALKNADIIIKTVNDVYEIIYDYPLMNDIMKTIKDKEIEIISTHFALKCKVVFGVRKGYSQSIYDYMKKFNSVEIKYIKTE